MLMEEKRNCGGGGGEEDNFPVGMRVLAVDDDPICLKVLENLLRKCHYHVNTTNQAIIALQMLRENKNNYDLVISDVNMPDMDGFKLLECVNFEMDLPVIMLSAHSDKELVYKGVTHGAVDYLLKPVRLEELRNIWQHVIRKKKCLLKSPNRSQNQDRVDTEDRICETQQEDASPVDVRGKVKCKRKDQDDGAEEEEGGDEDGNENDESSPQKKPRVVWSVDLHRKFVAAVDQLGLDKAVPKKILDLMNVEGLTRENVASHLQKYRLFLKRISTETSQQTNTIAGFESMESSYLRTGSPTGYGDFRTLTGPGRLSSTSLTSFSPGRMLGRLSSPSRLTIRGISSPGLLQPGNSPILSNSTTSLAKNLPSGHVSPYHGSSSFEANQILGKSPCQYGDLSGGNYSMRFTFAATNPLTRPANLQQNQNLESLLDQPPATMPSLHQDSLDAAISGQFLDYSSMNENQKCLSLTQIPKLRATSWPLVDPSAPDSLPPTNAVPSMSSSKSPTINIPADFSRSNDVMDHLGNASLDRRQPFLFADAWENNSKDYSSNANSTFITMNSLVPSNRAVNAFSQSTEQGKIFDGSMINLLNNGPPSTFQQPVEKSALLQNTRQNEGFAVEQSKSQAGYVHNNFDSLADIMNPTMKQNQNETTLDGEFGFNAYIS